MMEYGTGWLGREPSPWERHRWRLNLRGDSEGGGSGEDNRSYPAAFSRTSGFDLPGIDSITNRQSCSSLNFRRQAFQGYDMAAGQGSGGDHSLGRSCFMPGFSSTSSDNRDTYQRNFFGGNKDDFSERNPNNRPFGAHRDPVPPFCPDREPPFRSTTNMMRFGQNFSAQTHEFNNRSERAADGSAAGTGDRSAPFGRRMNNSPRFPQPGQFDVSNNRQGLTDSYFSGLPVDPWLPSGTGATTGPEWRAGGSSNQDFQSPTSGAQMYSASMALQRISTNQSRKRPWQQLLSAVGRRNSRDQDLPCEPDLAIPGDSRTMDGQGTAASLFPKGRPGRKQSKPLKHEGADQSHEDDLTLTPDSFTAQVKEDTSINEKAESDTEKFNAKADQDVEQVETPEPFALSVKSDSITEEKIDPEPEEILVETFGDYNDSPMTFEELRTLFPLTLMYGESSKDDRVWPRATVVLSTVEVQCGDARVRYCHIARNDSENHAEVLTMNKLKEISLDDTSTVKITLVMNYTPCFYCACRILSYFFDLKSRKVNVAMELKFSNLYRVHMYPCDATSDLQTEIDRNIDGLQTLHLNGVGLQTFSGVESWYENLLNSVFLDAECKEKVQEIVDIVESEERKEREERDEEDLCNILGL